jgi:hypothetical protein
VAEETLYFKVAGESDVWFTSQHIQAKGIKNEQVSEKLKAVQSVCDSIETNFYRLNYAAVQQSIRLLQNSVNALKSSLDEVTAANPSYLTKITFIGLPSDNPFKDMSSFSVLQTSWTAQQALINEKKLQLGLLPAEATKQSSDELLKLISDYADWQDGLPENCFQLLGRYILGFNEESVRIPETLSSVSKEKSVAQYAQSKAELNAFLDQRITLVPVEIHQIGSTQARLQAVRLFDGMLRSYLSSLYWAQWKDTRE